MKTYLYIAKLRMQTMLAYRMEVLTYTIMQALIMLSVAFFWKAAYGETPTAHGVTGNSMITYTVISALMGSMYYMGVEDRIAEGAQTVYRFRKDEISAAELMTDISRQAKIKDIRIEEANIDDIIRIAYNNKE